MGLNITRHHYFRHPSCLISNPIHNHNNINDYHTAQQPLDNIPYIYCYLYNYTSYQSFYGFTSPPHPTAPHHFLSIISCLVLPFPIHKNFLQLIVTSETTVKPSTTAVHPSTSTARCHNYNSPD